MDDDELGELAAKKICEIGGLGCFCRECFMKKLREILYSLKEVEEREKG